MDFVRGQSDDPGDAYKDTIITQQANTITKLREQLNLLQMKAFTASIEYQQRIRGKDATIANLRTQTKRNALRYTVDKEMLSTIEICEDVIENLDDSRQEIVQWKRELEKKRKEEEQVKLQQENDSLCVICHVERKEVVFYPCKHMCLCVTCGDENGDILKELLNKCPLCRRLFAKCERVYS
jgi:hypothetical protein